VGLLVAFVMVLFAFYNLKVAAAIATVYLLIYGMLRLRRTMGGSKKNKGESSGKRRSRN